MKKRSLFIAVALGLLFTGACGDDEDSDSGSTDTTAADESGGDGEEAAGGEFCSAYTELLAGEPTPEAIREVAALAPEAAVEPLEAVATGFETDGEAFFESEEFATNFATVGEIANDECADEVLDITAVDYAFEGIPDEVNSGTIGVNFSNEGEEFHELVVFKKNDGVTESFEEIFALGEEEAGELVTEFGGGFAPPGGSSGALFELTEPGEYVAVCFVSVGSTPENEEADGPPHFTQGMLTEFTVS
jgi:hypothetical protein